MQELQHIQAQLSQRALPLEKLQIEPARIRQAAVTLLLREQAGRAEMLIIKRAEHPGDPWSGHLALPGGRADANDDHLIMTATRETYEEVGISLDPEASFIGRLAVYAPENPRLPQIEITPLIALAPAETNLQLNHEVAAAFWLPVGQLKATGASDVHHFRWESMIIKRPAYPSPGGPIWGITERILTQFLRLLD